MKKITLGLGLLLLSGIASVGAYYYPSYSSSPYYYDVRPNTYTTPYYSPQRQPIVYQNLNPAPRYYSPAGYDFYRHWAEPDNVDDYRRYDRYYTPQYYHYDNNYRYNNNRYSRCWGWDNC